MNDSPIKLPPDFGRPKHFDVDKFVETVEMFVNSDEVIIGLKMLEQLPGYYRDNMPKQIIDLKKNILNKIVTVRDYINYDGETYDKANEWEIKLHGKENLPEGLHDFYRMYFCFPRSPITIDTIKKYNESDFIPHVVELGPSNYWLPYGLAKEGLKFTYEPITINQTAEKDHLPRISQYQKGAADHQPVIFVCFETIEHLWHPDDIYHYYARQGIDASVILMSTPKYTLLGGDDRKMERPNIEHLRTYTPTELLGFAQRHFQGYSWEYYDAEMMVIKGFKNHIG